MVNSGTKEAPFFSTFYTLLNPSKNKTCTKICKRKTGGPSNIKDSRNVEIHGASNCSPRQLQLQSQLQAPPNRHDRRSEFLLRATCTSISSYIYTNDSFWCLLESTASRSEASIRTIWISTFVEPNEQAATEVAVCRR